MQPFAVRRVRIQTETGASLPFDGAQGRLILLVTDDADFRAVAERVLRAQGFDVVTAAHAGHALLACLSGTRFDVLVTELSMPDMTGLELAERVRRYFANLPVVYVAGSGTAAREGVLVRPFTRDEFVQEIELTMSAALVLAGPSAALRASALSRAT